MSATVQSRRHRSGASVRRCRTAFRFLLLTGMTGSALTAGPVVPAAAHASDAAVLREGKPHAGPRAYHAMCARDPALCQHDLAASRDQGTGPPARLDRDRWVELQRLNLRLNAEIAPQDDIALYGQSDFWTRGALAGDCEDYIIAKKHALIAAGWAADQLLYAVVEGRRTAYHAVLIARTDQGELVLDNLTDEILDWQESGYRFIVRQSAATPHRWVRVINPGDDH